MMFFVISFWGNREFHVLQDATERYILCERAAKNLQDGSNYLTEQVRLFAITGQQVYMDNYFAEAADGRREKALEELRARKDVKWTYLSPAGDFRADGARTGNYILGGEELTLNSKGESVISYADYAIAMVDEAVNGGHIQQRISVVAE